MGTATAAALTSNRPDKNGLMDYNVVLSTSALCSIIFVSGFCWFFYYMCKNRTGKGYASKIKNRKSSVTSSVPGDPNGHFYMPPTNPHVYLDTSDTTECSRVSTARLSPIRSPTPSIPGYLIQEPNFPPQYFERQPSNKEDQHPPPPYPGHDNMDLSQSRPPSAFVYNVLTDKGCSDLPRSSSLPPPYST